MQISVIFTFDSKAKFNFNYDNEDWENQYGSGKVITFGFYVFELEFMTHKPVVTEQTEQ